MTASGIRVRAETSGDLEAVHHLLTRVPSHSEARLVKSLRLQPEPQVSLVATDASDEITGYILFTPVDIRDGAHRSRAAGLGPMAVAPERQRTGIGSALVAAGLAACAAQGEHVVVVLGHPDYYPRFGFRPAWDVGLYYRTPGANPAFMVCEIERGALRGRAGEVVYHAAFGSL